MSVLWSIWLVFFTTLQPAHAHEFAPSLYRVTEYAAHRYNVVWKTPSQASPNLTPLRPSWPAFCETTASAEAQVEGTARVESWRLSCSSPDADGLVGETLSVSGLAEHDTSALVSVQLLDGRSFQQVLTVTANAWVVPSRAAPAEIAEEYALLGIEHIWEGIDHLLFLFGLLLLVGGGTRLLWTTTAFTIGHSITLGVIAVGNVLLPSAPIEFAIAISIFVLAVELSQTNRDRLLQRSPWWLAGGFGLLHGMGFAGALTETGLPQDHVPLALLFFNLGIEAGQLAFLLGLLGIWTIIRGPLAPWSDRIQKVPVYALGILSAMGCIERAVGLM